MALLMAARILGPSLWDQVTNHSGRRMATIRLASLFATLTFSTVYFCQSYLALAVMIVAFGLSRNGILPQFEVVTLSYLDIAKQLHYYGRIRLWGSIGFILSVILLGPVLDRVNIHLLPTVILTLTMSIWILSLTIPESNAHNYHSSPHDSVWKILKSSEVLAFFTLAFLMQASHGPYNIFYTIYLEDYGYSRSLIGGLWALGVLRRSRDISLYASVITQTRRSPNIAWQSTPCQSSLAPHWLISCSFTGNNFRATITCSYLWCFSRSRH